MSVQFEEDDLQKNKSHGSILYGRFQKSAQMPGMISWLMRMGIKSESLANAVLMIIVIAFIAGSIGAYYFLSSPASVKHNVYHKKTHSPTQNI
jgi:hypothetical protein